MENSSKKIIVAFHVGRGGQYHNAGHYTFIGEKNFQDLINLNMNDNNLFEENRDEKGRFCKPYLTDGNQSHVTDDNIRGLVGSLNFDNQYNTDFACEISDCHDWQVEIIANSGEYKSHELIEWLENYNSDWKFNEYGFIIDKSFELSEN